MTTFTNTALTSADTSIAAAMAIVRRRTTAGVAGLLLASAATSSRADWNRFDASLFRHRAAMAVTSVGTCFGRGAGASATMA